jgi:hypothetical protein
MPSLRTPRPRVKPSLSVLLERHPGNRLALLHLALGKETHHYYLSELAADFGRAFRVEKFLSQGGESYDVLLDDAYGHCECLGFLRHGHCKHLDGLRTLLARGELWGPLTDGNGPPDLDPAGEVTYLSDPAA